MWPEAKIDVERIPILVREYRGRLKFVPEQVPYFVYSPPKGNKSVLELAKQLVESLSTLKW